MTTHDAEQLARQLVCGELSPEHFAARFADARSVDVGNAVVDLDRRRRCGFPEVIFGQGKSTDSMTKIIAAQLREGVDVFATRVAADQATELLAVFSTGRYNPMGRTLRIGAAMPGDPKQVNSHVRVPNSLSENRRGMAHFAESSEQNVPVPLSPDGSRIGSNASSRCGKVTVVTAGTSDLPIAEEARETLLWMGVEVSLIQDVGVAGPHRLAARVDELRQADAIVVIAGMEGALPSVVGGYVACPVIAVPTSVGYGASFGGLAALLGMLNSCAANVAVVNIDAGFKGAYLAGMIAQLAARDP